MSVFSSSEIPATPFARKRTLIELAVIEKPLGRHVHHDPRSRNYLSPAAQQVSSVMHPAPGLPLRQPDRHLCGTAHALCGVLNCSASFSGRLSEHDALLIAGVARQIDTFSVNGRPVGGSSALLASQAARALGYIESFQHAYGVDHALRSLVLAPLMTGFEWFSSFDAPDPETSQVRLTGRAVSRGGHEVMAVGIDMSHELVWLVNSWGPGYGRNGRFCMSFELWDRLLQRDGDVTTLTPATSSRRSSRA